MLDILVITHDRPAYTKKTLTRLLETCEDWMAVWIWHNGMDRKTLEVARSFASHPRVAKFHHSVENVKLRGPTNWFWSQAQGELVSKVDDDCLMPHEWARVLRQAHEDNPVFGAIAGWRFMEEDFDESLAARKIRTFAGGHKILQNFWVPGGGYMMKRRCITEHGMLRRNENFTEYCIRLALGGYVNGWYYPFLYVDHMDDPRSPNTGIKSDDDLRRSPPLSASLTGATTVAEWEDQMRQSARKVQAASIDPRDYRGVRSLRGRVARRIARGRKGQGTLRR